jgi:hypothetical protein
MKQLKAIFIIYIFFSSSLLATNLTRFDKELEDFKNTTNQKRTLTTKNQFREP